MPEDVICDDIPPSLTQRTIKRGCLTVELGSMGPDFQEVIFLVRRVVGFQHDQPDTSGTDSFVQHGDLKVICKARTTRFPPMIEGFKQPLQPDPLAFQATPDVGFSLESGSALWEIGRELS